MSQLRPGVTHGVSPGFDPSLEDAPSEFDASVFLDRYAYQPQWPLPAGLAATIRNYEEMSQALQEEVNPS